MDLAEIEGEAEALIRTVGAPDDPPSPLEIAAALGLEVAFASVPEPRLVAHRRVILLPLALATQRRHARHPTSHELAEFRLDALRYFAPDREVVADLIAAAVVIPRRAFQSARRLFGTDYDLLADLFDTRPALVALRHAEIDGFPCGLVTPRRVHRRDPWGTLPSDARLRRIARDGSPGWRVVRVGAAFAAIDERE